MAISILEWIVSVGGTDCAATLLDETPRAVGSWRTGERVPKPQTAKKIIQVTKGRVDYNSIYQPIFNLQAKGPAK